VSIDAAKAGEVDRVKDSLRQISNLTDRVQAAHEAVRLLAKRGLRKQAIEIAKTIEDVNIRNQALSELAQ
jgi:C4-dicarboxylate-specific signal transduction histidine kinase